MKYFIIGILKFLIKLCIYPITYLLGFIIWKDEKIWLFKGFADRYIDNSKYLFEYINKHNTNIKVVWITNSNDVNNQIRQLGYCSHLKFSIKGLFYSSRAKIIFYGDYTDLWTTNGSIWVNLWHGIPLKKIEHDIRSGSLVKYYKGTIIEKILYPSLYRKPDYIVSSSSFISEKCFSSAFRISPSNCLNFGLPRNKYLNYDIDKIPIDDKRLEELLSICKRYESIYLYLPTWRPGDFDLISEAKIDLFKLNEKMITMNSVILFKFHPASEKITNIDKLSNIILLNNNIDLYKLIPFTDCLITDYSSVFYDYLLTDKPIIFFPFDYQDYIINRELYFDYNSFILSDKVFTFEELLNKLGNIESIDKLKEIKKLIWEENNNNSSELIVDYFMNKLEIKDK